jgi:hypothetical protein
MADTTSRLRLDPATNYPGPQTFGELSNFLRGAVADEESRQLSESMGQLASHIEAIVAALRITRARGVVAPQLMDLLTVLREHRNMVVGLGLEWRGLYEYAAYLQTLNNFRLLIGQWLLGAGPRDGELMVSAEDFELVAWRTLGDGALLVDMYEQWNAAELDEGQEPSSLAPQLERAMQWWKKLRL